MADSPSRLVARATRASSAGKKPGRVPVWLYLPNLIGYARFLLSVYGLSMVAGTVRRRAAAAAVAASSSPMLAVVRMASHYMASSSASSGGGGLLHSGTVLGRGLDHLLNAAFHHDEAKSPAAPAAIDADLLAALLVFAVAALLDALDGHVARAYNQCSNLGVVLDIVADNVLRACLWMTAALLDARFALPAVGFVSCEWLTLLASQVVSRSEGGVHWKRQRERDPWIVRAFFGRGFRNPLGVMGIGGLFLAPLWPLLRHSFPGLLLGPSTASDGASAMEFSKWIIRTAFDGTGWAVWAGRLLSLGIECYFVWGLVRMLCQEEDAGEGAAALWRPVNGDKKMS